MPGTVNFTAAGQIQLPIPAASVGDAQVAAPGGPGQGVAATKLIHQRQPAYNQESATNAASEQRTLYVMRNAGTLVDFSAGAVVLLTGADTCTVDLWKNGASVLTAPIALAAGDAARTLKAAAGYASITLAAGDWLEVKVIATHTSGTLPKGVAARLTVQEDGG